MKARQRPRQPLIEIVGWLGVAFIILAYVLLSTGIVAGQSIPYQLMMLVGSASIAYEAWSKRDRQPTALNLIFMVIALISLISLIVKQ